MYYLENEEYKIRMSLGEREFAQGFQDMMRKYYLESGLSVLPQSLHGLDDQLGDVSMGNYFSWVNA